MVNLKLYYFDLEARGEPIRALLHYTNQSFEDFRISFQEWPEYKPKMPFGKMPVLEVDGKMLPESFSIMRYIAKKHRLIGKDDIEQAQIDALADLVKDFGEEIRPWYSIALGFAQGDKESFEEAYQKHFVPAAERILPLFKRHLKDAGNGFYFRGGICWLDFVIPGYFDSIDEHAPGFYDDHPEFAKHSKKIKSLPQLQNYLATKN